MKNALAALVLIVLLPLAAGAQGADRAREVPGEAVPGWIGISFEDADGGPLTGRRAPGVRLVDVFRGSPADRAGLRPGDRILGLDGRTVTPDALRALGANLRSGDRISLVVVREGGTESIDLVANARPFTMRPGMPRDIRDRLDSIREDVAQRFDRRRPPNPYLLGRNYVAGAEVTTLNAGLSSYFDVDSGVLVTDVIEGSPAAQAELLPGDVITAVGGIESETVDELRAVLERTGIDGFRRGAGDSGEGSVLTVIRRGEERVVRLSW